MSNTLTLAEERLATAKQYLYSHGIEDAVNYMLLHGLTLEHIDYLKSSKSVSLEEQCQALHEWETEGLDAKELLEPLQKEYQSYVLSKMGFQCLTDIEERTAEWLIDKWLPKGQIVLVAGDGGVGKTSLWVNLLSGISSGHDTILHENVLNEEGKSSDRSKVAFFTTEDSISCQLKKRLRLADADMGNIMTYDFSKLRFDDDGRPIDDIELDFGSDMLRQFISAYRPSLCIFDPIQAFIPKDIQMGSRNAMRHILAPLTALGENYGTTFILLCHSNKRKGAFGRDRISDSADLWDIARSVIMIGDTEDKDVHYLSNEKNNYCQLQDTILFSINDDGQISYEGATWKRDREYQSEKLFQKQSSKADQCADAIMEILSQNGCDMFSNTLIDELAKRGFHGKTVTRASGKLSASKLITKYSDGFGQAKRWHTKMTINYSDYEHLSGTDYD